MSGEPRGELTDVGDVLVARDVPAETRATPAPKIPDPNQPRPDAQQAAKILPDAGKNNEPAQHGYNFAQYTNEDNSARLNSFGAAARAVNVSQEQADAIVRWHEADVAAGVEKETKIYEEIRANDLKEIQRIYGDEFNAADARVMSYVNSYPESTRIRLGFLAADKDGFKILDGWAKHAPVDIAEPAPAAKPAASANTEKIGTRAYWKRESELDALKPEPREGRIVGASTGRFVPHP